LEGLLYAQQAFQVKFEHDLNDCKIFRVFLNEMDKENLKKRSELLSRKESNLFFNKPEFGLAEKVAVVLEIHEQMRCAQLTDLNF
jgi:hypothetical protein